MTALDLAAQFADRAQTRQGALLLSVKQVAFFRSLASKWAMRDEIHYMPRLSTYDLYVGSERCSLKVWPNGAGLFKVGA